LHFTTRDIGNVHVVSRRAQFFELFASENVQGNKMDLCVTVLSSLGSGHIDYLTWAALDNDETVLAKSRALHGIGCRGTGVGAVESVLMLVALLTLYVFEKWLERLKKVCAKDTMWGRRGRV
jgi:hypothetical protein